MNIFGNIHGPDLRFEDRIKADALVRVVAKSTASLDDATKLADALGLKLSIIATSKPEPKEPANDSQ